MCELNALTCRRLAQDEDYLLQTVTVFKKVRDEYVHKCRENKWVFSRCSLPICELGTGDERDVKWF